MKDLIEKALKNIEAMSKDQFDKRVAAAKNSQIALALRDFDELSDWYGQSIRASFRLEQLVMSLGFSEVRYPDVEDVCLMFIAANDERFALAA